MGRGHGMSPERLARIDDFLERKYVASGKIPGSLTLVARRGEIAHLGVRGLADRERGTPLAEDTIFRIYSMTKPITSVAFMMLVEEGRIALDDPVHLHIPEWRDLRVYAGGDETAGFETTAPARPMLVIDLLRHTAGLTYGFQNRTDVDAAYRTRGIGEIEKGAITLDRMIAGLAGLPLEFSPGEKWNYSVATDVLGYLIERISGQAFEDYLRERLLTPLGMVDTDFQVRAGAEHPLAACYALTPSGRTILQDDPALSSFLKPPAFVSGGGGLVGTAQDYLKFAQMLLSGGAADGRRYISRKTLDLMTANHLPGGVDLPALSVSLFSEANYNGIGFGLGFATTMDPAKTMIAGSAGDYFWGGAASTAFWIDPVEDLICIFMTQLIPSSSYPVRRELKTMVYAAIED
ncbi:serine hydrolase domain-containing protein [Sphingosinicella soli]|uniref:CubicO group peptidase (Beta-lactamase class C family) n=1 Tax=Sphingosinicella soli TaxID=333708 RepID=A0A7W7F6M9_9SPHN|nr:serine hydrolase domain-containing protein [Sphingosinicella soli]MBB4631909.1 CubicO group peptidase (beta-lactamase class C family) [Sphingosinicella soli]